MRVIFCFFVSFRITLLRARVEWCAVPGPVERFTGTTMKNRKETRGITRMFLFADVQLKCGNQTRDRAGHGNALFLPGTRSEYARAGRPEDVCVLLISGAQTKRKQTRCPVVQEDRSSRARHHSVRRTRICPVSIIAMTTLCAPRRSLTERHCYRTVFFSLRWTRYASHRDDCKMTFSFQRNSYSPVSLKCVSVLRRRVLVYARTLLVFLSRCGSGIRPPPPTGFLDLFIF
jgi:hypothetical protein